MIGDIFLLLGSNLGDRETNLEVARSKIQSIARIRKLSGVYKTAPWGKPDQPAFYNQVIAIETAMVPDELLNALLSIEMALGRERHEKWGSRVIDIDILFYKNDIISNERLKIPHPQIANRRFTLVPLQEIAPELVHPVLGKSITELLGECEDRLEVERVGSRQ
jgi:2-amino-4-hydroxy-6-hydroxymethyldihydropteridine diphosphokinase